MAFETIPSLAEAAGIARVLEEHPGMSAWISFSCRDAAHVCHGESLAECVAALTGHPGLAALGINCTAPRHVPGLLQSVSGTALPILVYPNSGETWVAAENRWTGSCEAGFDLDAWWRAGARGFGGCCRTGPEDIARIRAELVALRSRDTD